MIKRVSKKQPVILSDRVVVPDLVCRDPDVKYMGSEPDFSKQPSESDRKAAIVFAFNWYNRFFDKKVAKEQISSYLKAIGNNELSKEFSKVDESKVILTYGWLARLYLRGLELTDQEKQRLMNEVNRLMTLTKVVKKTTKVETQPAQRVNVQEIMRERAKEVAGELEGNLDDFVKNGAKASDVSVNVVGLLSEKNIMAQHVNIISTVWKKKLTEFNQVQDGKDKALNEAYAHLGKNKLKALIKYCETVLSELDSYINVKKVSKTPRKKKPVSIEKMVSKVKFLKKFDELNLVSLHPGKLVGATEAWLYDTAKRKIWYLVADSHVGTLGIKGATILGFDSSKSGVKTVRKPVDIIKKLMAAGKPASRKIFTEIASVHAQSNGRTNENLIILKVY